MLPVSHAVLRLQDHRLEYSTDRPSSSQQTKQSHHSRLEEHMEASQASGLAILAGPSASALRTGGSKRHLRGAVLGKVSVGIVAMCWHCPSLTVMQKETKERVGRQFNGSLQYLVILASASVLYEDFVQVEESHLLAVSHLFRSCSIHLGSLRIAARLLKSLGSVVFEAEMLVDRRWANNDDARILLLHSRMGNDLLHVLLVRGKWDMLTAISTFQASVVCAE